MIILNLKMAEEKMYETESFEYRRSEFSKHAYKIMKKDSNRDQDYRMLKPLVFNLCNGSFPRSFSDADTNYRKQKDTFQFDVWYMYSYKQLLHVLAGGDIQSEEQKNFKCLFDHFFSDRHTKCLQGLTKLIQSGKKVNELTITTVMALHYFKPLMPNSEYIIDKYSQNRHSLPVCEFCKEKINFGDTSMGNKKVWHGTVDILLNKSVVKVNLEKDIEDLCLEGRSEDGSEDSEAEKEDCEILDSDSDSDSSNNIKIKIKSQIIAEAIVNAFYNSRKNPFLFHQFVPSFLVTEKNIRVVLYNCKLDICLMSTKMPIWKKEGAAELDLMTLIRIWLALNYSCTMDKKPEDYNFVLKNTSLSRFQNLISKEAHSLYLKDLHQPMSGRILSDYESYISDDEYDSETDTDTRAFKLKCLLELNNDVNNLKKV